MKAVVAGFNQEKALVGALSVITNLRMNLFEALMITALSSGGGGYQLRCKTRAVLATTAAQCAPSQARTGESCAGCWPPVTRQSRGLTLYGHWTLHPPHYTQADIYHASSVFMNINILKHHISSWAHIISPVIYTYLHMVAGQSGQAGQGRVNWPARCDL